MTDDDQTLEQWSGYCARNRDEILAMIRRMAHLLFGIGLAEHMLAQFEPGSTGLAPREFQGEQESAASDEAIEGFPEATTSLEQVHAVIEGLPQETRLALVERLAWTHRRFADLSQGRYLIRADFAFLLQDLFHYLGKPPLFEGFVDEADWHYELKSWAPPTN